MFCQTYKFVVLVCGILALAGLFDGLNASANDKKDDKDKSAPSGAWVRKEAELKIEFDDQGVMRICPHGDGKIIAIVCDAAVEKDGRIKVKVTGYEGDNAEKAQEKLQKHIPVGLEFSFKWAVKDKTAKLDDLIGEGDPIAHLKEHLEGDYEKK
jgi:hypothetical protein